MRWREGMRGDRGQYLPCCVCLFVCLLSFFSLFAGVVVFPLFCLFGGGVSLAILLQFVFTSTFGASGVFFCGCLFPSPTGRSPTSLSVRISWSRLQLCHFHPQDPPRPHPMGQPPLHPLPQPPPQPSPPTCPSVQLSINLLLR